MPEGRHERTENPVALGAGGWAEAHAVEALFLSEQGELVGSGGVFWIDAADAEEALGIFFQNGCEVAVVPSIVDDLDEDGSGDVVGQHETEERLWCCVFGGWVRALSKREGRIMFPDVDV
jgi:hypothetical protein